MLHSVIYFKKGINRFCVQLALEILRLRSRIFFYYIHLNYKVRPETWTAYFKSQRTNQDWT